ncbi:MAG: ion transporter [Deltaproteobacteria bacterium]|nr:ion transporter [Deltaproteobacteria bacterium]
MRQKFKRFLRANLMTFVVVFLVITWLGVSYFVYLVEYKAADANITSYPDSLWWGIVTFLTVGYGDRYPVTGLGRVLGTVLMLSGVVAIGILTAKISSYFLEQVLRKRRGLVETNHLNRHFVVCGWKEDIHEILLHVLAFNPDLKPNQLILVANISQSKIDAIREHPRLSEIQVVPGDYYQETVLRRAAPERARKVLILADQTPGNNNQVPSMIETDSHTIMTAMTLANIAKGTLVAAEIYDPKMDQYLKLASVNEIIYTEEYRRLLLGNASAGTGITNILFDLLSPKTPTIINTKKIPDDFLKQKYMDFKKEFEKRYPDCVVIGILENTGNSHLIKERAIRKAQKTPDVKKLVQNLKLVKQLKCNDPVLNPVDDYIILDGSLAIVLENRFKQESSQGNSQGNLYDTSQENAKFSTEV